MFLSPASKVRRSKRIVSKKRASLIVNFKGHAERRPCLIVDSSQDGFILLHLRVPVADSVETASVLRSKLPHIKVVGFSSVDLENRVSPAAGFDAVISKQDGLSKLVETLKALMPEPPRE